VCGCSVHEDDGFDHVATLEAAVGGSSVLNRNRAQCL
jgi:hypothetical protein